jgi:hypothetical protein
MPGRWFPAPQSGLRLRGAAAAGDFEQPVEGRNPDELDGKLVLGNDPDEYVQEIRSYAEAGYTHVYVHQIGPEQEAFLKFAKSELFSRPRRSLHGAKGHRPSLCSRIAQPTIKGGSR